MLHRSDSCCMKLAACTCTVLPILSQSRNAGLDIGKHIFTHDLPWCRKMQQPTSSS